MNYPTATFAKSENRLSPWLLMTAVLTTFFISSVLGSGAENIRLNQIGFYQYGPKMAAVISSQAWRFSIKSPELSITYFS